MTNPSKPQATEPHVRQHERLADDAVRANSVHTHFVIMFRCAGGTILGGTPTERYGEISRGAWSHIAVFIQRNTQLTGTFTLEFISNKKNGTWARYYEWKRWDWRNHDWAESLRAGLAELNEIGFKSPQHIAVPVSHVDEPDFDELIAIKWMPSEVDLEPEGGHSVDDKSFTGDQMGHGVSGNVIAPPDVVDSEFLRATFNQATPQVRQEFIQALPDDDRVEWEQEIEKARQQEYQELIFGTQNPAIGRFDKWLTKMHGTKNHPPPEIPNERKPFYVKAVHHICDVLGVSLILKPENQECTLTYEENKKSIRFLVKTKGGKSRPWTRIKFPPLQAKKQ